MKGIETIDDAEAQKSWWGYDYKNWSGLGHNEYQVGLCRRDFYRRQSSLKSVISIVAIACMQIDVQRLHIPPTIAERY